MSDRSPSGNDDPELAQRLAALEQEVRDLRRVVAEELFELRTRLHSLASLAMVPAVVPPGRPKLAARLGVASAAAAASSPSKAVVGPKRAARAAAGAGPKKAAAASGKAVIGPKKAARRGSTSAAAQARAQVARELDAQTRISEPVDGQPA